MAQCPFCAAVLNAHDILRGKLKACPHCGKNLGVSGSTSAENGASLSRPREDAALAHTPARSQRPKEALAATEPSAALSRPTPARGPTKPTSVRDLLFVPPTAIAPAKKAPVGTEEHRQSLLGRLARLDIAVLTAFCLASLALLLASIPALSFLTKPLSSLGLLLVLLGGIVPGWRNRAPLGLPLFVTALCLLDLLAIGNWPRWASGYPPTPVRMPLDPLAKEAPPLEEEEWVDASSYAIRAHNLRVQVLAAKIVPSEIFGKSRPAKLTGKQLLLLVGVSLESKSLDRTLTYETWAEAVGSPSQHAATLADNTGRLYPQIALDLAKAAENRGPPGARPAPKGADHKAAAADTPAAPGTPLGSQQLVPGRQFSAGLVYPVPAPEIEYLRLELPKSALGLPGQFRFRIPRKMIQRQ
jgi:hypothetical protein